MSIAKKTNKEIAEPKKKASLLVTQYTNHLDTLGVMMLG